MRVVIVCDGGGVGGGGRGCTGDMGGGRIC